jgi:hypothetical protein
MDTLTIMIILSLSTLSISGIWFGIRFLKSDNALLGWEWIILGTSATNAILYFITSSPINFHLMVFLDSFSRTIGVPIIGGIGLLILSRDLKVPTSIKIGLFAAGAVLGGLITAFKPVEALLPSMAEFLGLFFIVAQIDFAVALYRNGLRGHAIGAVLAMVALQTTAVLDGLLKAPAHPNGFIAIISNFWVYSNVIWSIAFTEYYFAYEALLRRKQRSRRSHPN